MTIIVAKTAVYQNIGSIFLRNGKTFAEFMQKTHAKINLKKKFGYVVAYYGNSRSKNLCGH